MGLDHSGDRCTDRRGHRRRAEQKPPMSEVAATPAGAAADRAAGEVRNHAMVEALQAAGLLTDARTAEAMRAVPRHQFAPHRGWFSPDRQAEAARAIHCETDPHGWRSAVYSARS